MVWRRAIGVRPILAVLLVILSAASACTAVTDTAIVATWDGGKVSLSDVEKAFSDRNLAADSGLDVAGGARNTPAMARYLAVRSILLTEAARLKVAEKPEYKLDAKFAEEEALADLLAAGIERDIRGSLKEDQVRAYYNSHRREFLPIQAINARRIRLSAKKHGDADARALAEQALQQLGTGVDFGTVAGAYSDLPPDRAAAQTYPVGFWNKENWFSLVDLGEGGTSGVLTVEDGYEIVHIASWTLAPDFDAEQAFDRARVALSYEQSEKRMAQIVEEAEAAFPMICGQEAGKDGGASEDALLRCGGFTLTRSDAQVISDRRAGSVRDCTALENVLRNDYGQMIWAAEWARNKGYPSRDEYKSLKRFKVEQCLQFHARMELIRRWLGELQFTDQQIKNYYDTKWKGHVDPMLHYDCLMVQAAVAPEASEAEREAARAEARDRAVEIIGQLNAGMSFDQASALEGVTSVPGQSRVVNADDEWDRVARGIGAGQVAAEPIYDGGAMCIVRVKGFEDKRKTPYDTAKNGVVDMLRREAENAIRSDFENELLKRYQFNPGTASSPTGRSE